MPTVITSDRKFHLFLAVAALLFFCQGLLGNQHKSFTYDEAVFVASGYTYLQRNDFRLDPEAPPLMQELAALPLLALDLQLPKEDDPHWKNGNHFEFSRSFFVLNRDQILPVIFLSRLPALLLGSILIVLIGLWGKEIYGLRPALFAASLAAFSPNLLAHAKLATTDMGCTVFMFAAVFAFWEALRSNRLIVWSGCGFLTGLALLAKYTSLLLFPIYFFIVVILLLQGHRFALGQLTVGILAGGLVVLVVVGAGYNFSFDYHLFLRGLQQVYTHLTENHRFYLLGETSASTWWYYYLVAFLLKVPVPIILLILMSCWGLWRHRGGREAAVFLLVPTFIVIGISCFDKANYGLRRILPALPFLFLFTAQNLAETGKRLKTLFVFAMLGWVVFDAAMIYPHHLAYFNMAAGGPLRGPSLLDDSNIDWGQDLLGLAEWLKKHPEAGKIKLCYVGNVKPKIYGITHDNIYLNDLFQPEHGYYAVSVQCLINIRKYQTLTDKLRGVDWITQYEPIDRIGYSIYIYRF